MYNIQLWLQKKKKFIILYNIVYIVYAYIIPIPPRVYRIFQNFYRNDNVYIEMYMVIIKNKDYNIFYEGVEPIIARYNIFNTFIFIYMSNRD